MLNARLTRRAHQLRTVRPSRSDDIYTWLAWLNLVRKASNALRGSDTPDPRCDAFMAIVNG